MFSFPFYILHFKCAHRWIGDSTSVQKRLVLLNVSENKVVCEKAATLAYSMGVSQSELWAPDSLQSC